MSRLLRHLVESARGPAPTALKPRLPSRFEGGRERGGFTEERVETTAPGPGTALPLDLRRTDERPAVPASLDSQGPGDTAPAAASPAPPAAAPVAPAPAAPLAAPPFVAALRAASVPAEAVPPREVPTLLLVPSPPVPLVPPVPTLLVERWREPQTEARPPAPPTSTAPAPVRRDGHAPQATRPAPSAAHAPAVSRSEPSRPPAAVAPPSAPAVRVTIGRIDIRAVPPAPPAAPARRPAPEPARGVTLDDYLARRGSR
jgi:hypothetical protein